MKDNCRNQGLVLEDAHRSTKPEIILVPKNLSGNEVTENLVQFRRLGCIGKQVVYPTTAPGLKVMVFETISTSGAVVLLNVI